MHDLQARRKKLKDKLRKRELAFAGWTSLGDPQITEVFTNVGFDFIGIDIEHGTSSFEQCQRIIAAAQAGGTLCLPRIASHSMEMIKRLLDSGADGIVCPMIDTKEQALDLVKWVKYPSMGNRSFGMNRAQNYGFDFDSYVKEWNDSSIIIAQIESIKGVENIAQILSVDGIDAVMVGPYDLSGSLDVPGQIEHEKVVTAARRVIDSAKTAQRGCGSQMVDYDVQSISAKVKDGYSFLVLSSDIFLLWKWAEKTREVVKSAKNQK